jgi:hypothetical protein
LYELRIDGLSRESVFTRRITQLFSDDEYRRVQEYLVTRPGAGDVIQGSGGIRKLRWGAEKRGKSGGVRFIYYWHVGHDQILMLYIFAKNEAADLTQKQLQQLRAIVEAEYP